VKKLNKASHWIRALAGLLLVVTGFVLLSSGWQVDQADAEARIDRMLQGSFEKARSRAQAMQAAMHSHDPWEELQQVDAGDEAATFLYQHDSLIWWSSGQVPTIRHHQFHENRKSGWVMLRSGNGWNCGYQITEGSRTLLSVSLFYADYPFDNAYLVDHFPGGNIPFQVTLGEPVPGSGAARLQDPDGREILEIRDLKDLPSGENTNALSFWLIFIGLTLMLHAAIRVFFRLGNRTGRLGSWLLYVALLAVIRMLLFEPSVLSWFSGVSLFDPRWYASSSFYPSLADLMFNALFLSLASFALYIATPRFEQLITPGKWLAMLLVGVLMLSATLLGRECIELGIGLVMDSKINLNVTDILSLDLYSYSAFAGLGGVFFAFVILVLTFNRISVRLIPSVRHRLIIVSGVCVAYTAALLGMSGYPVVLSLFPGAIALAITVMLRHHKTGRLSFMHGMFLLALFSVVASVLINAYSAINEADDRVIMAERLANNDDPLAEIMFAELEDSLRSDRALNRYLAGDIQVKQDLIVHLEDRFFKDHWDKYEIEYYIYRADSSAAPYDPNALSRDYGEFLTELAPHLPVADSGHLLPVADYFNKLSYLVNLPLGTDSVSGYLLAELRSKQLPDDIGFPELLIDRNTKSIQELTRYSVARYSGNRLVTRLGDYNYPVDGAEYLQQMDSIPGYRFFNEGRMNHLVYVNEAGSLLLISLPMPTLLESATTFSYLFIIFGILLSTAYFARRLVIQRGRIISGLNAKVRTLLFGISLLTLLLFGMGTRYFILEEYTGKNNRLISEKLSSVQEEIRKKVGHEPKLTFDQRNYLNFSLRRFSEVFFTDISLYDPSGHLLASSRNEVFHAGLLPETMHPLAYRMLTREGRSEYIQEEAIGGLKYLCGYAPFIGQNGQLLGYISLPYFAKQDPLENEVSNLLVTLINIFVFLLALSVIATLFVAGWVTRPLKVLEENLSSVQLGKLNKPLEYSGDDEIGHLVKVYNQKVADLEAAAAALARSERETAWREMARQVAHEIKNPLTPMKLSVQHFQRSFDKDDPEAGDRLRRFSQMMIEQIDTLTHIADEFSHFAKMPKAKAEMLDVNDLAEGVASLFSTNGEATVTFQGSGSPAWVYMDKDELQRVCTNLVKNAIQAIPESSEGLVDITVAIDQQWVLLSVTDNGTGIPAAVKPRIFQPNFTTKSSGTGLGLAMVRSIVEQASGDIWFEDNPGGGTRFVVKLPQAIPVDE
jgi:signal transduction histidine kinase